MAMGGRIGRGVEGGEEGEEGEEGGGGGGGGAGGTTVRGEKGLLELRETVTHQSPRHRRQQKTD